MLSDPEISDFIRDGFVAIRQAVPADVVSECVATIGTELLGCGVDLADRSTWVNPVERIGCPDTPAFAAAGTQPALWDAYDQVLGQGTWWRRAGVGGTIPVRFPHNEDPGDADWHIDGSYDRDGAYWVNVRSRDRGLLCLFLFSDVSIDDAPTELKVGSHHDLPRLLERYGDDGAPFTRIASDLSSASFDRPSAFATGWAGDVFICHPFIVHRATWPHRGTNPRIVAQPGVRLLHPFNLDISVGAHPVERAILSGLRR